MVTITIYSKKDCHLCEIAKEALINIRKEFPFSLTEVDIEKNKAIFEKYKYLIPVIEIDGEKTFTYKLNEAELKKILKLKSQPR
jgi:glutaredoxin